jgi:hypothetical protein
MEDYDQELNLITENCNESVEWIWTIAAETHEAEEQSMLGCRNVNNDKFPTRT